MVAGGEQSLPHRPRPGDPPKIKVERVDTLGKIQPVPGPDDNPPHEMDNPNQRPRRVAGGDSDSQAAYGALSHIIRKFLLKHASGKDRFLPAKLVSERLTSELVETELSRLSPKPKATAREIHPHCRKRRKGNPLPGAPSFVVVFSLLCLQEKGKYIDQFIAEGISDSELPLEWNGEEGADFCLRKAGSYQELSCMQGWAVYHVETFLQWQWRLTVPFFTLDPGYRARYEDFTPEVLLPWSPLDDKPFSRGAKPKALSMRGGYGSVKGVRIQPECHGFGELLDKLGFRHDLFALKVLHRGEFNDEAQFSRELDQLRRFNGLLHPQLVTLLVSFTQNNQYHFLFPLADCDLSEYYDKFPQGPAMETAQWFHAQMCGLTSAVTKIHRPHLLDDQFGRHGDLKPENILWYCSAENPDGMLVITDLGLAEVHRKASRSNIPNKDIPFSPEYRPPECDIKNGTISRAFDIWTLGCIFLEMCIFIVGGSDLLNKFGDERTTPGYLTGVKSNVFYNIHIKEGTNKYVIQVKPEVTKWFDKVRAHERCTQFLLDILEVVENQMLIVLSDDHQRSSATEIFRQFDALGQRGARTADYWLRALPKRRLPEVPRVTPAVEVDLNDTAMTIIRNRKPRLVVHRGKTHSVSERVLTQK